MDGKAHGQERRYGQRQPDITNIFYNTTTTTVSQTVYKEVAGGSILFRDDGRRSLLGPGP